MCNMERLTHFHLILLILQPTVLLFYSHYSCATHFPASAGSTFHPLYSTCPASNGRETTLANTVGDVNIAELLVTTELKNDLR